MTTIELERAAYITNDPSAALLARIADLEAENEALTEQISDLEDNQLTDFERGELTELREFFRDCFFRLPGGDYPAPSVFSDYDKSVIFDIIDKSEP